jgi:hypothetical protein
MSAGVHPCFSADRRIRTRSSLERATVTDASVHQSPDLASFTLDAFNEAQGSPEDHERQVTADIGECPTDADGVGVLRGGGVVVATGGNPPLVGRQ